MRSLRTVIAAILVAPSVAADPGALYLRGEGAEALLLSGDLRVPASRFACAGCHGADARGRREGGTEFPALDWASLADPARPGGSYDENSFLRAVTEGVAPDGRRLSAAMPRYVAEPGVLNALIDYLRSVGEIETEGLSPDRIQICADENAAAGLRLAAEVANADGGIFGRRLVVECDGAAFLDGAMLDAALGARIEAAEHAARRAEVAAGRAPSEAAILSPEDLAARPDDAGTFLLSLAEAIARPALNAELPVEAYRGYLEGIVLTRALFACGRRVTRSCALDALGEVEIALFLQIYGPIP